MSILVTGGTGAVGRPLVDGLLARGAAVRVVTRFGGSSSVPPGVETVSADVSDVADGSPCRDGLFDDVEAVFVFPVEGGVEKFVSRAVGAGVRRFVVLSSLAAAVEFPRDRGSASATHHLAIENAVTSRVADWTILRPGTFANNLRAWAPMIRNGGVVRAPYVRSAQAPIHEADIADAAAAALTEDGHARAIHPLTGPQSLTKTEQVAAIAAGTGVDAAVEEIGPETFRAQAERFMPAPIVSMLLDYWSDTVTRPDEVRSGVRDLTGQPGRTLERWARDHRDEFVGATASS